MYREKRSFRILGIKTGKNCEIDGVNFIRSLEKNTFYPFYQDFKVNKDISKVTYENKRLKDLYNTKSLKINISAIVGENGAGKSTIIELMLLGLYNLGAKCNLLDELPHEDDPDPELFIPKKLIPKKGVKLKLLFEISNKPQLLSIESEHIELMVFERLKSDQNVFVSSPSTQEKPNPKQINRNDLDSLFYSILINYSHYSLNSNHLGEWIRSLFHKNDGYQTPIVINPMRSKGNIDINVENYLITSRLLSNILEPKPQKTSSKDTLRQLSEGKLATALSINVDKEKVINKYAEYRLIQAKGLRKDLRKTKEEYFEDFKANYKNYFIETTKANGPKYSGYIDALNEHFELDVSILDKNNEYVIWGVLYLLKKIEESYYQYFVPKGENHVVDTNKVIELFKKNDSHVSFKIKQAVYFLKYVGKWEEVLDTKSKIELDSISRLITKIKNEEINHFEKSKQVSLSTIELIPPSFLDVKIHLENDIAFDSMSSGEKQKIYSISSIAYHLTNLNSVKSTKINNKLLTKYKFVNIVFDEIELYYHPNWQRRFIYDLLDYLKKINPMMIKSIEGINFLFITHSPFILSDIPSNNILRLKDGKAFNEIPIKSFGANIHEMLSDSFFLENGAKGEFAIETIKTVTKWLNQLDKPLENNISIDELDKLISEEKETKLIRRLIQLIDEPIVQRKLAEMYDDLMKDQLSKSVIEKEIEFLQILKKKLNK